MRKLYFILYLLCVQSLFAQKLNLFIGPEMKIDKEMNFFGHLHHDASGHYVMLTESSGKYFYERKKLTPIIQKYDHKFKLLFSRELVVDIENIAFENCFYAKNKFLLCTQKIETKEKTLTLHATSISMKGDASKPQRLTQIQWNEKNDKPNNVNWAMSQDTTKLLVATYADADDKELRTKISLTVQSSDLEKLWGRGFTLPYSQEQFSFENLTLGNNGKVYLLAKI